MAQVGQPPPDGQLVGCAPPACLGRPLDHVQARLELGQPGQQLVPHPGHLADHVGRLGQQSTTARSTTTSRGAGGTSGAGRR